MSDENRDLDVIIIGAGPAGLSAAIWCKDVGLRAIVLEKDAEPGGQLLRIYNAITNYPGVTVRNGRELRDRFLETAEAYGVEILTSTEVVEMDAASTSVITSAGRRFSGRSIVLATGVRRRRLNVPGESEFAGKGIIESGSRDKESVRGKTVAIIGGGDAALENALILAEYAAKVYVVHRRGKMSARKDFVKRAYEIPSVEFIFDTEVTRISGPEMVESIGLIDRIDHRERTVPTDVVLIRIGVEPNSEILPSNANLQTAGYISTDVFRRAAGSNTYAIGDVANRVAPTVASAVGDGATAAKAAAYWLRQKK